MRKKLRIKLRILLIGIVVFIIASWISVYSYGIFAKRVQGEPSYALPVQADQSSLDHAIEPQWQAHPGQTGMVLLQDNLDAFMIRAITAREAGRSLDLQYYIWHDDLTGHLLDMEVLRAADRGVRVRMLLDDMNAHGRDSMLAALDMHPNIEVRLFNPTRARDSGFFRGVEMMLRIFSVNRRMHNKAWIADGRVAVVGGRNIGDEYFDASDNTNFFDVDLLISGDAVAETSSIFDDFWNSKAAIPLSALVQPDNKTLDQLRERIDARLTSLGAKPYIEKLHQSTSIRDIYTGERPVHWSSEVHVYSDPADKAFGRGQFRWLVHDLLPVWKNATEHIELISPYFVPGQDGMELFEYMRSRHVEIDVLTNSLAATDVMLSHSGYAPYRSPLLQAGVNLYELKPFGTADKSLLGSSGASLHTKAFLVDGRIGFVGSFNFDPRSIRLNTELGIIFEEPTVVAELEEEFNRRTSSTYSYQVLLDHGQMRWKDRSSDDQIHIWTHDPQTKWWQRATVKVMSWLPIESQL